MELNAIFSMTKVDKAPGTYAFGSNNDLIVRNETDMKNFKDLTTGHTLIMGRNTFESLGSKALPDRKMIVISSMPVGEFERQKDCVLVRNLNDAIKTANEMGSEKAFLIGGADLLRQGMLLCKNVYYTLYYYNHPFNNNDVFINVNMLLGTKMFSMTSKKEFKEECTIVATGEKKKLKIKMITAMNSDNFKKELAEASEKKKALKAERAERKANRKISVTM